MSEIQPLHGRPALLVSGSWVVVADLHVGLEEEMGEKGVGAPYEERMLEELCALSSFGSRLIVLGDLRHRIGYVRHSMLPSFMSRLLTCFEQIDVVPGNHDAMIARAMPGRVRVHRSTGFAENGIAFIHGHTWPSPELMQMKTLLMGHMHPAVAFRDSLGNTYVEKCWFRVPFKKRDPTGRYKTLPLEVVVVPAFNPMISGTPVNRKVTDLGPIFRERLVVKSRGQIYLLDGTFVGTVSLNTAGR